MDGKWISRYFTSECFSIGMFLPNSYGRFVAGSVYQCVPVAMQPLQEYPEDINDSCLAKWCHYRFSGKSRRNNVQNVKHPVYLFRRMVVDKAYAQ